MTDDKALEGATAVSATAVVAVLFLDRQCRRFLAVERKSGKLGFPGGKIEVGESEISALEREIHEEIGDFMPNLGSRLQRVGVLFENSTPVAVYALNNVLVAFGRETSVSLCEYDERNVVIESVFNPNMPLNHEFADFDRKALAMAQAMFTKREDHYKIY